MVKQKTIKDPVTLSGIGYIRFISSELTVVLMFFSGWMNCITTNITNNPINVFLTILFILSFVIVLMLYYLNEIPAALQQNPKQSKACFTIIYLASRIIGVFPLPMMIILALADAASSFIVLICSYCNCLSVRLSLIILW